MLRRYYIDLPAERHGSALVFSLKNETLTLELSVPDNAKENGIDAIIKCLIRLQYAYDNLNFKGTGKKVEVWRVQLIKK